MKRPLETESIKTARRNSLEHHNGRFATWWHYNRAALAFALMVIAALLWQVRAEKEMRHTAQAETRQVFKTAWPMLGCWTQPKANTIIIAGATQEQFFAMLYATEQQLWQVREAYILAQREEEKTK